MRAPILAGMPGEDRIFVSSPDQGYRVLAVSILKDVKDDAGSTNRKLREEAIAYLDTADCKAWCDRLDISHDAFCHAVRNATQRKPGSGLGQRRTTPPVLNDIPSSRADLSEAQVRSLYVRYLDGEMPIDLAAAYGRGRQWLHGLFTLWGLPSRSQLGLNKYGTRSQAYGHDENRPAA